ncbi:unnamed protein product [Rotaria sp. Silwood1]|nr:unnamed protein product [Rotaria sp. Silwood1]CAF4674444.1 unnamed protein product [Rotaria sp. Silwood1]CAF4889584.1 unnamed protein product [Rotaria sp. Silwood1]
MHEERPAEDYNDDFPFNGLFFSSERIFVDFDRLVSNFSTTFSIPSHDFNNENPRPSTSLRDEVLKQEFLNNQYGDENLDSTIE